MEIYRRTIHENEKYDGESIRGNAFLLVVKLATILVLFELLYAGINYFLTLGLVLPFNLHHHISEVLFVFEFIKLAIQLFLILHVCLSWANYEYHLSGKHIIRRKGIIHIQEDVFHFDNIRSISINQSFLGKVFNYGDITLKTSASGGYQGDIVLAGIASPKKYKEIIERYF